MKKILLCVCLILAVFAFTACNSGGTTVDQSWAANETLIYSVTDTAQGNAVVGEASFVTTTKLTDEDKAAAPKADTKTVVTQTVNGKVKTSVYYAKVYRVLKLSVTYTDASNNANDYVLNATHDGNKYVYDLKYPNVANKNKSGKLKVGNSGYTDGEFLYFYIRCHDISAVPSSIKVADPFNNTVHTLGCSATANNVTIPTESSLGSVICDKVEVNRSDSPVGKGLTVYLLPKSENYRFGEGSMIKSVGFPTRIVENNLVYTLKDFSATK